MSGDEYIEDVPGWVYELAGACIDAGMGEEQFVAIYKRLRVASLAAIERGAAKLTMDEIRAIVMGRH